MNDKWKWIISLVLFVVVLNGVGIFIIGEKKDEGINQKDLVIKIDEVTITIQNKGNYSSELMDEMTTYVQEATKLVLSATEGILIPKKEATIRLVASSGETNVLPSYQSSEIVDPDARWLGDWNFEEMMVYLLFPTHEMTVPFTTIGIGQYLYFSTQKGEIYDAHEMWIIHKGKQDTIAVDSLLSINQFTNNVLMEHGPYREFPNAEAHYWKLASFTYYLIDTYGLELFLQLNQTTNLKSDIESVYGKSLFQLQQEWEQHITDIEEHLSPKFRQDLNYQYEYLYE